MLAYGSTVLLVGCIIGLVIAVGILVVGDIRNARYHAAKKKRIGVLR